MNKNIALNRYRDLLGSEGPTAAQAFLAARLSQQSYLAWQAVADELLKNQDFTAATFILDAAIRRFPKIDGLQVSLARTRLMSGDAPAAERILAAFAHRVPVNEEAVWMLADARREQGKYSGSVDALRTIATPEDTEKQLACLQWMRSCQRDIDAAGLVEKLLVRGRRVSPQILAVSGQLALALGDFEQARSRFQAAIHAGIDIDEWFVPLSLSMTRRYASANDPDARLFDDLLQRRSLTGAARGSLLFAKAKILIDTNDFAEAATCLREGNLLLAELFRWSSAAWQEFVESRVAARPLPSARSVGRGGAPIFIVGLPRTGTSLVAETLSARGQIPNRGEAGWLPYVAERLLAIPEAAQPALLDGLAQYYRQHLVQDDGCSAYYIDKNPNNFRYVDLIGALFPDARVIHCRRNLRDTAVSVFAQYFSHADNGFAYRFADIAEYAAGERRLMGHWQRSPPVPIYTCDYETLVSNFEGEIARVANFLGLDAIAEAGAAPRGTVATASAWQVRQAVTTNSVGRWTKFSAHLPEMISAIPDVALAS